jgi:hypothetical protein
MKDEMLRFITEQTQVTFAELTKHLGKQSEGDCGMFVGDSNILLWIGVSAQFVTAFSELKEGNLITMTPTEVMTYVVDGKMLNYPIAKSKASYKAPHWLPVVLNATKAVNQ